MNCYCTVAADGLARSPVLVTKIYQTDQDGKKTLIYEAGNDKGAPHRALTHRAAYFMWKLLEAGRTDAGGTSMALNQYIPWDTDFGGKTGTSNNHADAWFIAVSPRLVCGAWVGGEYRQIHFRTGALGQGSRTALPVVGNFLRRVMADPTFSYLHKRFPADETLNHVAEMCNELPVDTLENDSTLIDSIPPDELERPLELDEDGNPVVPPPAGTTPEQQSQERVRQAYS